MFIFAHQKIQHLIDFVWLDKALYFLQVKPVKIPSGL